MIVVAFLVIVVLPLFGFIYLDRNGGSRFLWLRLVRTLLSRSHTQHFLPLGRIAQRAT